MYYFYHWKRNWIRGKGLKRRHERSRCLKSVSLGQVEFAFWNVLKVTSVFRMLWKMGESPTPPSFLLLKWISVPLVRSKNLTELWSVYSSLSSWLVDREVHWSDHECLIQMYVAVSKSCGCFSFLPWVGYVAWDTLVWGAILFVLGGEYVGKIQQRRVVLVGVTALQCIRGLVLLMGRWLRIRCLNYPSLLQLLS